MIKVSEKWIENQKQHLTSESFIKISFKISDLEATSDATLDTNGETWFSKVQETIKGEDKSIIPYATLEPNLWLLDGNKQLLPKGGTIENTSYIGSELSLDSCLFANNPIIDIALVNYIK